LLPNRGFHCTAIVHLRGCDSHRPGGPQTAQNCALRGEIIAAIGTAKQRQFRLDETDIKLLS